MGWGARLENVALVLSFVAAGAILVGIVVLAVHVVALLGGRNDEFTRSVRLDQGIEVLREDFESLGERMEELFGSDYISCGATAGEQSGRLLCDFCTPEHPCAALLDCEFAWEDPYQPECSSESGGLFTSCSTRPGTLFHCGYSDPTIRLVWCEPRPTGAVPGVLRMRCFNRGGSLP
jgi:hypothetical protein